MTVTWREVETKPRIDRIVDRLVHMIENDRIPMAPYRPFCLMGLAGNHISQMAKRFDVSYWGMDWAYNEARKIVERRKRDRK